MKTIGQAIKETRVKKNISFSKLAAITKIKKEFIQAIEKENWQLLPEYPVVTGFVKNIAQALGLNRKGIVALLRRDYPPKELTINPKPDVAREFVWSPKLTFFAGIALVTITVFGYLIIQYIKFISPPKLIVDFPKEQMVIKENSLKVSGDTDPEATLKINNQPVILDQNGHFSADIEVFEGTKEVKIISKSRSGKETVITRKIEVKLNE